MGLLSAGKPGSVECSLYFLALWIGACAVLTPHAKKHFAREIGCEETDRFFSRDYVQARSRFIEQSTAAGAKLHQLEIVGADATNSIPSLTIDIAELEGDPERLLLHMSGVHGVEGFAGSGIQNRMLESITNSTIQPKGARPTIMFVHSVNPYGMYKNRRWNENNVDLNRNWLEPKEFESQLAKDPNRFNYVTLDWFINPSEAIKLADFFWPKTVLILAQYGMSALKQTLVTGQYHNAKGLWYGGKEKELSLKKLSEFLKPKLKPVKQAVVIDVHTGLGKQGADTLILTGDAADAQKTRNRALELFATGDASGIPASRIEHPNLDPSGAATGYSEMKGSVLEGVQELFPEGANVLTAAQEFGTVNGVLVFRALREENAAHHFADTEAVRNSTALKVRDVFYLKDKCDWKSSLLSRGAAVFNQALDGLMQS